jgi:hypothetical protein
LCICEKKMNPWIRCLLLTWSGRTTDPQQTYVKGPSHFSSLPAVTTWSNDRNWIVWWKMLIQITSLLFIGFLKLGGFI